MSLFTTFNFPTCYSQESPTIKPELKLIVKVKIRPLESSDKSDLAKLANNKKVWDNLRDYIPYPYNENDADIFINSTKKESPQQNFGIEYKDEICGVIGLIIQKDVYRRSAEIGYWTGEPYWRKGIASKAVELIIKYGFDELNLNRIFTGVFDYNTASMRVLEKNGFEKEGIFKNAIIKNGNVYDEHRYGRMNKSKT